MHHDVAALEELRRVGVAGKKIAALGELRDGCVDERRITALEALRKSCVGGRKIGACLVEEEISSQARRDQTPSLLQTQRKRTGTQHDAEKDPHHA